MPEVNQTIVENATTHIERIPPRMSVDEQGNIIWSPVYRDHNAALFHRGKIVTNAEFNELFLKGAYQANYLSDTLKKLFNDYLNAAIFRSFTSSFDIVESFVKPFTTADWGAQQEDGYYYIDIPAEEHGFIANDTAEVLERMSIATQMFLLGADDKFYEVSQVEIDTYNNVRLYTDDNTLSGIVIIKMNDKAYTLAGEKVDASFVQGLATVGISGKYTDLVDIDAPGGPNPRLASLEDITQNILSGATTVPKAQQANVAERILSTSYIQGIKVSDIFETGSNYVKNATNATNAINAENATNAANATKVNNLNITQDANGVLKIGDTIIPQKKLLWSGETNINPGTYTGFMDICSIPQFTGSKTIEVHLIDRNFPSNAAKNFILKLELYIPSDPDIINQGHTAYIYDLEIYTTDMHPCYISWSEIELTCSNFMLRGSCRRNSWTEALDDKSSGQNMYVTKVYEIIE